MAAAGRSPLRIGVCIGGAILSAPMAFAQAVERHPAPILHGTGTARLDAGALAQGSTNATPFGVDLSGIMLVDAHGNGAARAKTGAGIDTSGADAVARRSGLAARLRPFLGQPLSYKVISEIEAAVTAHYRENGRSLVLVTVPPQEITSGVLQVNVNTFRLEDSPTVAGDKADTSYVQRQIRIAPGQEVDTARLLDDVTWLNLNPFRKVAVSFAPGKAADGTRMTLQVQSKRPWSAYAGASNAGSPETGPGRVFAGFNISALPWKDQQLSYQINIAPNSDGLWDVGQSKGYASHALSYFVPLTLGSFRVKATLGLNHVSSFALGDAGFATKTETTGKTLELSFPLPRHSGGWSLVPEVYLGYEADDYTSDLSFGGILTPTEETTIRHVELGLRSSLNGRLMGRPTHGDFDISILRGRQETAGQPSADYSMARFRIAQEIGLEGDRQLALRLSGQYSPDEIHALEQLGLGDEATVRGYGSNAASSQSGASLSIEYRLTPIDLPVAGQTARVRPHVFADWGFAAATAATPAEHLAAVGLGTQVDLGEGFQANLDISNALSDAGKVEAGQMAVALRLMARF